MGINGDFSEKFYAEFFGDSFPSILPEEVVLLVGQFGRGEIRHVFDDAENRHADLVEHLQPLARVDQREVVGRRDDHRPRKGRKLGQGERGVPGPGRKVDDEVVEFAPGDIGEELFDQSMDHGPAPNDGRIIGYEKSHGHELEPVSFQGNYALIRSGCRAAAHAGDERKRRSVYIGVENANPRAALLHGECDIECGRAFADSSLPGSDCENVLDSRENKLFLDRGGRLASVGSHAYGDLAHALERTHRLVCGFLEFCLDGAGGGGELDLERHLLAVNFDVFDKSEVDNILFEVRVLDGPEGVEDLILCNGRGHGISLSGCLKSRSIMV